MSDKQSYETYCPQCEERVTFNGEVVVANDGTMGAQGPCPACETIVTKMIATARHGDSPATQSGLADGAEEVVDTVRSLFSAICAKNLPKIQSHYLHDPRLLVFLEGPQNKVEGFDQKSNEQAWRSVLDVISFTDVALGDDLQCGRSGNLGWVGGSLRLAYRSEQSGERHAVENRGTWVLEKQGEHWRIVFEHVSFPVPDPYPM